MRVWVRLPSEYQSSRSCLLRFALCLLAHAVLTCPVRTCLCPCPCPCALHVLSVHGQDSTCPALPYHSPRSTPLLLACGCPHIHKSLFSPPNFPPSFFLSTHSLSFISHDTHLYIQSVFETCIYIKPTHFRYCNLQSVVQSVKMKSVQSLAVLGFVAAAQAAGYFANTTSSEAVAYTTVTTDIYTTYCPEATTFTQGKISLLSGSCSPC